MPKVQLLRPIHGSKGTFHAGEVIERSDEECSQLVDAHAARYLLEPGKSPSTVESTALDGVPGKQTADAPRMRKR